jgi:hypothetical protein
MAANRAAALRDALAKLEKTYGRMLTPGDPLEAGVLAVLAAEAPELATEETRDRIRQSFVDWNEVRVADPWDVSTAMEAGGDPSARRFARGAIAFLESVQKVLNRCSFEVPAGEPVPEWPAALDKMRGATPAVRAVCLAMLTEGGWHATPEMVKSALKLGVVGKTTSAAKVASGLAEVCGEEDRLRAHYLLARYGARGKDDPDPLGAAEPKKKPAKKSAKA